MLPALLTTPRKLVLAGVAAAFATAVTAPPAAAWGVKEQQFLAGVVTTLVIGGLVVSSSKPTTHSTASAYPSYRGGYGSYQGGYGTYQGGYAPPSTTYYYPSSHAQNVYATPAAQAFNRYSLNERLRIQSTLTNYGYYHGTIDGAFGPQTFNAVKAYARNIGKAKLLGSARSAYAIYNGLLT